jgi:hypothetical protein
MMMVTVIMVVMQSILNYEAICLSFESSLQHFFFNETACQT